MRPFDPPPPFVSFPSSLHFVTPIFFSGSTLFSPPHFSGFPLLRSLFGGEKIEPRKEHQVLLCSPGEEEVGRPFPLKIMTNHFSSLSLLQFSRKKREEKGSIFLGPSPNSPTVFFSKTFFRLREIERIRRKNFSSLANLLIGSD